MAATTEIRPAVATRSNQGRFKHQLVIGPHSVLADEPVAFGGTDQGPTPYDFLAAALAACTSMTLHLYAERKKLAVPPFRVEVRHRKVHAQDCQNCLAGAEGRIDEFERLIIFDGPLEPAVEQALRDIADRCPVDQTLRSTASIATRLEASNPQGQVAHD